VLLAAELDALAAERAGLLGLEPQVAQEAGLTMQMAEDVIGGFELDAEGWQPHSAAGPKRLKGIAARCNERMLNAARLENSDASIYCMPFADATEINPTISNAHVKNATGQRDIKSVVGIQLN